MYKEDLYEFRKQIDACIIKAKKDYREENKKIMNLGCRLYLGEMSIVITKLEEAKMWAGKCQDKAE